MQLFKILKDQKLNKEQEKIEISKISIDFDQIQKGDLFFDLKSQHNINKIFEKGASFVVREGKKTMADGKRFLWVENIRKVYALSCKNLSSSACDKMKIIGITGTNGKTSTVRLVADILKKSGKKVGTIGTLGAFFDDKSFESELTTPDPHILHGIFSKMQKCGVEMVVMEISAHAIALDKIEGINFDVTALTNITQDHLDFFGTMENYAKTKMQLLQKKYSKQSIVCIDDERIVRELENIEVPFVTYGIENPSDIFAIDIIKSVKGIGFVCNCLDEIFEGKTTLIGEYNLLNCLCAIGICYLLNIKIEDIISGLETSKAETGRFNLISNSNFDVVIDFAHTPDGMEKVLQTAKPLCKGNLIVVFGCGGNRDSQKRPLMGSIASLYADKIFITSDNPRFENPDQIMDEIKSGISTQNVTIESDRKKAIQLALSSCQKNDLILILGKGGEEYQIIFDQKISYSDFDEVYSFFRGQISALNSEKKQAN